MKKFSSLQPLTRFNRKKKKKFEVGLTESTSSIDHDDNLQTTSPLSPQPRTSPFRSMFSPRSFKGRAKLGENSLVHDDKPTNRMLSPVSEDDATDFSTNTSTQDGAVGEHHCAQSLPNLSPAMAAIEARTEEMFRSMQRDSPQSKTATPKTPQTPKNEDREDHATKGSATPTRARSVGVMLSKYSPRKSKPGGTSGEGGIDRLEKRWTIRGLTSLLSKRGTVAAAAGEPSDLSSNWLIDFNELTIGKTIGHSSFGTVCQGTFNGTNVAVKTIQCDKPDILKDFQKEAELNCKLRHPNIVLFMGICVQPTKVCLVTELMSRGNVRELLLRPDTDGAPITWSLRKHWALDTARGMAYLHSLDPPMIHRDLKTTNLLVDRGMCVKICDFGLSRVRSEKLMSAVGTVQFSAPEVLRNEFYSENADLFSFGTVMWELYTRSCVFDGLSQMDIYTAVMAGEMPTIDNECDERYRKLMMQCWSMDPTSRPTFRDVINSLSEMVDDHPLEENSP